MKRFLSKFGSMITGVLSGFDRLLCRGTLQSLSHPLGIARFFNVLGVRRVQFREFSQYATARIVEVAEAIAAERGRPAEYLTDSSVRKDEVAREIAQRDGIKEGLVCQLSCVEPCWTFGLEKNSDGLFEFRSQRRKCKFLYNYWIDPVFGFSQTRLQTWFPFHINFSINGREMLSRQMDAAGVKYTRRDNCFTAIDDLKKAQALAKEQLSINWAENLDRLARLANPALPEVLGEYRESYYWSVLQSEWAIDFMFKSPEALQSIFRPIVMQAMADFSAKDVLRFLGKRPHGLMKDDVTSRFADRPEGICIRHSYGFNWVKVYDKWFLVFRVEPTINHTYAFPNRRPQDRLPDQKNRPFPLRKSVADLYARARISQQIGNRYLDAIATTQIEETVSDVLRDVTQPACIGKTRMRGIRPHDKGDLALIKAVSDPKFVIEGFRNADLREILEPAANDTHDQKKKASARISRKIRMLKAHGLIKRPAGTKKYYLTERGRSVFSTILALQRATAKNLHAA